MSLDDNFVWSVGNRNSYGWALYLSLQSASILANVVYLCFVGFVVRSHRTIFATLMYCLIVVDLLEIAGSLTFYALNLHFHEFYGRDISCEIQSFLIMFFVLWKGWTLAVMSYSIERSVSAAIEFTDKQIFKMFISSGIICIIISSCGILLPGRGGEEGIGYRLYSSGTYCFVNISTVSGGLCWYLGSTLPLFMIICRYNKIWKAIKNTQIIPRNQIVDNKVKLRYYQMAKKMIIFSIIFFICLSIEMSSLTYERITGFYVPPWVNILSLSMIHLNSLLNPIVFVFLNEDYRQVIYKKFIPNVFKTKIIINKSLSERSFATTYFSMHFSSRSVKRDPISPDILAALSHWQKWFADETLSNTFRIWCDSNFVGENYSFLKDVRTYQQLTLSLETKLNQYFEYYNNNHHHDDNNNDNNNDINEILSQKRSLIDNNWFAVVKMINSIYELYLNTPNAPLEINIPCAVRHSIQRKLGMKLNGNVSELIAATTNNILNIQKNMFNLTAIVPMIMDNFSNNNSNNGHNNGNHSNKSSMVRRRSSTNARRSSNGSSSNNSTRYSNKSTVKMFNSQIKRSTLLSTDIWSLSRVELNEFMDDVIHLFDECSDTIEKLMSSDVFPRFRKDSIFHMTAKEYEIKTRLNEKSRKSFRSIFHSNYNLLTKSIRVTDPMSHHHHHPEHKKEDGIMAAALV